MGIVDVLVWIVFGGLVGWIASKIMGTDAQQGLVANVVVGIIGALLGGLLAQLAGFSAPEAGFNVYGFLVALVGAIILLWIVKLFRRSA